MNEATQPGLTPMEQAKLSVLVGGFYDVQPDVAVAYTNRLCEHITNVIAAGRRLGVPDAQILRHDLSKFGASEFPAYARHFCGGGSPREFAYAFQHHLHHNPHHWQHWVFLADSAVDRQDALLSGVRNSALEMPLLYVREMIADWIGASLTYTGSEDMTQWLTENSPTIRLHPNTAEVVSGLLNELGYRFSAEQWGSQLPKTQSFG